MIEHKSILKRLSPVVIIIIVLVSISCNRTPCEKLPETYSSYDEAIETVESAKFKVEESVNTSKSSWIKRAYYYSCDGNTGYFILKTDKQKYIYEGMPIDVWEGFQNADSFGKYYHRHIKGRYQFNLNN